MHKSGYFLLWTFILFTIWTTSAFAQQRRGAITGRVSDKEHAILQGARIVVQPGGKTAVSDSQGQFTIPDVAPGHYTLTISYVGFEPFSSDIAVTAAGAENVETYQKTALSQRQYCKKCGGHLMTNHPSFGFVDVYAATIPTLAFAPSLHVNYAETVLPMRDGLPKLKDFPAELGGTGETVAE